MNPSTSDSLPIPVSKSVFHYRPSLANDSVTRRPVPVQYPLPGFFSGSLPRAPRLVVGLYVRHPVFSFTIGCSRVFGLRLQRGPVYTIRATSIKAAISVVRLRYNCSKKWHLYIIAIREVFTLVHGNAG